MIFQLLPGIQRFCRAATTASQAAADVDVWLLSPTFLAQAHNGNSWQFVELLKHLWHNAAVAGSACAKEQQCHQVAPCFLQDRGSPL